MRFNPSMDIADMRRQALRRLIETRLGGVSRQLALACRKPEGQITDMLANPPRKAFGEKIARQMEATLGLPDRYLDRQDSGDDPSTAERASATYVEETTTKTRASGRVEQSARAYGLTDEEIGVLDGYRAADDSLKRTIRLLAADALLRFSPRRANHQ